MINKLHKSLISSAVLAALVSGCTLEIKTEDDETSNPTDNHSEYKLLINEVRSTGGGYDYIELYNAGSQSITFADGEWAVNDEKGFTEDMEPGVKIPAGTSLAAGEFLLIAHDETSVPFGAPSNTVVVSDGDSDFGLGKGDTALLIYKGEIVDSIHWQDDTHVETYGRLPDGGDWHTQDEPLEATPGAANKLPTAVVDADAANILINEVVSKGRDDIDFDYVELFNNADQDYTFAADEWELRDGDLEDAEPGLSIPAGTVIPAKGFLVLLTNEESLDNLPDGVPSNVVVSATGEGFGLGKEETITLYYKGNVHESISYGDFHVNSYGRLPDGGDYIPLADENAPQLFASPGRKNFATPADVLVATTLNFSAFNDDEASLEAAGFRVFGKGADLAHDVEPEYVAVSADSTTAWVSLQENNGLAKVDLINKTITEIMPLGYKDFSVAGNEMDASDKDDTENFATYDNVLGIYQPDGIATFARDGVNYVITANEGDVRDWFTNFEEGQRVADVTLDDSVFTDAAMLQQDDKLGRLNLTQYLHSDTETTLFDKIYSFGARSFSIWNADTGTLVFDSGSELAKEAIIAGGFDDGRSDAKGVEPESVTTGMVGGKLFAFVALERADMVAVYDISDLSDVKFSQMLTADGDDAPEGVLFISASDSESGKALLVVSNEDSGSVTVYQADDQANFSEASRIVLEGGEGAAEISAYDTVTKQLYVVNNGELLDAPRIEMLDLADPSNVLLAGNLDTSYYGAGINSVAVSNGKLAAAIQAEDATQQGTVVVFDTLSAELIAISKVGALPDMVTFSPDGKLVITADEGEPSEDYQVDPLGSVSIIELAD